MDSVLYAEFLLWKEKPSLDHSSAFLSRISREDVGPCLSFTSSQVSAPRPSGSGPAPPPAHSSAASRPAAVAASAERRGEQLADHRARGRPGRTRGQSLGGGGVRAQVSTTVTGRDPPPPLKVTVGTLLIAPV